jgi:DNA-binding FadR family transcriptional regulator
VPTTSLDQRADAVDTTGEEWFAHRGTRLHREALDALLTGIVTGRYAVGDMLPKEESLATEFEISRGTAREALRALEERRVVAVKHGRGARVQPQEQWNTLDPIVARALASGRKRRDFLREIQTYRRILECEAAAMAADRATDAQRAELRATAEELEGGKDVAGVAARIRRLVAVASANRPLATSLRALDEAIQPPVGAKEAGAYRRLADAVAGGDPNAARDASRALNAVE